MVRNLSLNYRKNKVIFNHTINYLNITIIYRNSTKCFWLGYWLFFVSIKWNIPNLLVYKKVSTKNWLISTPPSEFFVPKYICSSELELKSRNSRVSQDDTSTSQGESWLLFQVKTVENSRPSHFKSPEIVENRISTHSAFYDSPA